MQIILPVTFFQLGDHRKFKYLSNILETQEQVINFFISELNYKKYAINKVAYNIRYRKQKYQNDKINKLVNPHITS